GGGGGGGRGVQGAGGGGRGGGGASRPPPPPWAREPPQYGCPPAPACVGGRQPFQSPTRSRLSLHQRPEYCRPWTSNTRKPSPVSGGSFGSCQRNCSTLPRRLPAK